MASRKLVRDIFLTNGSFYRQLLTSQQVSTSSTRLRLLPGNRQFSVFDEFSKRVKGEANRNQDFQQSVKVLKEKAEELKGVTEDLKVRTKQTTEQLYKQVDGAWTEVEATAKKVKETFRIGKEESSEFSPTSAKGDIDVKNGEKATSGEEKQQQSGDSDSENSLFGKFKSSISSVSPKIFVAFQKLTQKLKEAKPIDLAKKGYDIVKDKLSTNPNKRKRIEYGASSPTSSTAERSTRTDVAIVPSKQSKWSKKWDAFKEKIAEDIRDRWETTDNPVVHKIQDLSESVFGETAAALSFKEIRRRDPSFSLPEFVAEVQEVIKPVLDAYFKGNAEVLKKYCSNEVIERCKAEHKAYESQGIFFENKILHISDVEVRETKMMGDTPIIIVMFQTQQVYCVRDRLGAITEGGKVNAKPFGTQSTVYYAWAMQQVDIEELGE
ncbi:hypothetical protein U1Q18_043089, partial [Sarracenia purpurea var. burkii]